MPKKYLSFLVVSITLLSFSLARTAYCLDPIDPNWPVISQYVEAVKQLYPGDDISDEIAVIALAASKFVANDARSAHICEKWINGFNNCLTLKDPLIRTLACKATSDRLDLMYKSKLKSENITSSPEQYRNAHVLAAYVMDEFFYGLDTQGEIELLDAKWCDIMDRMEMIAVGKTTGDPGRGSPTGASGDAVPAGGSSADSCRVGGDPFHGGAGGPAPYSMGAGGVSPSSLNQAQIGTQMPGANPCPINFSKAGWGAGSDTDEGSGTDGSPTEGDGGVVLPGADPTTPEDDTPGSLDYTDSPGEPAGSKGPFTVDEFAKMALIEKGDFRAGGMASPGGGSGFIGGRLFGNLFLEHKGGGGSVGGNWGVWVGIGIGGRFRPGPDSDLGGGICSLGSKINACFGAGDSEEDKCRHEVMQKCMAATCDVEAMMGSCSSSGGAANALDLTKMPNYGLTDPVDEPQGAGPAPQDPLPGYMPRPKPGGPDPINPNFFRNLKLR